MKRFKIYHNFLLSETGFFWSWLFWNSLYRPRLALNSEIRRSFPQNSSTQGDLSEFKASMFYRVTFRTAKAIQKNKRPSLKLTNHNTRHRNIYLSTALTKNKYNNKDGKSNSDKQ